MNQGSDPHPRRDRGVDRKNARRTSLHAPAAGLGAWQALLIVTAAASEIRAPDPTPPNIVAAVAFALLFLAPGILALLRSGRLALPEETPDDRRLWLLLGLLLLSITANMTVYRVGLVLGFNTVGLALAILLFLTTISLTLVISFYVVRRNATGLEIPVDLLDVLVFAAVAVGLMEVLGGPRLNLSPRALGTRAWIAVSGVVLGFYLVSRVHRYRGLPFGEHTLVPMVVLALLYSAYSALTFRIPSLPYWPDPVLRAVAGGSVMAIPLAGNRRDGEVPKPQRRYETYRVSLGFLAAVLAGLVAELLVEGRSGVATTLQGMIVVITGLILVRQYLSYLHGKRIFERARLASERYTGLVKEASDPIVELDGEGRVTLVNSAFCREFLIPEEEIVGRRLIDLVDRSPFEFYIAPETKKSIDESHRTSSLQPANVIRVRFRTPQGEKIFEATGRQSRSLQLQLIFRDVTERVELDRQIAELSERLTGKDRSRSELLMKLIGTFEDERRRTARVLLEGPARDVEAAAEQLVGAPSAVEETTDRSDVAETLKEARALLSRAVQKLRKAVDELRPTILEQKDLEAAVRMLANELLRGSVAAVDVRWRARPRLSHGQENLLYSALRDVLLDAKADLGLQSVHLEAMDYESGGIRIDLTFESESQVSVARSGTPPKSTPGEPAVAEEPWDTFISPSEKIEAIGGTFSVRRSPEGPLQISIRVESVLGGRATHPARESA